MTPLNDTNIHNVNEDLSMLYEVEKEQAQRYCEIIDLMVQLIDRVNGHPKKSVQLLQELKKDLSHVPEHIEDGVLKILECVEGAYRCDRPGIRITWVSVMGVVALASLSAVVSSILTLMVVGQEVF